MKRISKNLLIGKYLRNCVSELRKRSKKVLRADEYWELIEKDIIVSYLKKQISKLGKKK